jgi:hypothetical protein
MKNTATPRKESGKVQIGLLIAVALVAGGAGVWSELQAAGATVTTGGGKSLDARGQNWWTDPGGYLMENGDGTAYVYVWAPDLGNGTALNVFDWAASDYSISANIKPGHSGKGTGSGTGHFIAEGEIYDSTTYEFIAPTMVRVELTVAETANVSAYISQGVSPYQNYDTGEIGYFRQHSVGNQAYGETAGSISISGDGISAEATGGWGSVGVYSQHSVVRIK